MPANFYLLFYILTALNRQNQTTGGEGQNSLSFRCHYDVVRSNPPHHIVIDLSRMGLFFAVLSVVGTLYMVQCKDFGAWVM